MQKEDAAESAADWVVGGAIVTPPGPRVDSKVLDVSGLRYAHDDNKDGAGGNADGFKETRHKIILSFFQFFTLLHPR